MVLDDHRVWLKQNIVRHRVGLLIPAIVLPPVIAIIIAAPISIGEIILILLIAEIIVIFRIVILGRCGKGFKDAIHKSKRYEQVGIVGLVVLPVALIVEACLDALHFPVQSLIAARAFFESGNTGLQNADFFAKLLYILCIPGSLGTVLNHVVRRVGIPVRVQRLHAGSSHCRLAGGQRIIRLQFADRACNLARRCGNLGRILAFDRKIKRLQGICRFLRRFNDEPAAAMGARRFRFIGIAGGNGCNGRAHIGDERICIGNLGRDRFDGGIIRFGGSGHRFAVLIQ